MLESYLLSLDLFEHLNMKTNLSQVLAVSAALAVKQVQAFWGTAHLIGKFLSFNIASIISALLINFLVARQAQAYLEEENPTALANALNELATLKKSHSTLVKEGSNPFTECAIFADTCKSQYPFQAGWHFID